MCTTTEIVEAIGRRYVETLCDTICYTSITRTSSESTSSSSSETSTFPSSYPAVTTTDTSTMLTYSPTYSPTSSTFLSLSSSSTPLMAPSATIILSGASTKTAIFVASTSSFTLSSSSDAPSSNSASSSSLGTASSLLTSSMSSNTGVQSSQTTVTQSSGTAITPAASGTGSTNLLSSPSTSVPSVAPPPTFGLVPTLQSGQTSSLSSGSKPSGSVSSQGSQSSKYSQLTGSLATVAQSTPAATYISQTTPISSSTNSPHHTQSQQSGSLQITSAAVASGSSNALNQKVPSATFSLITTSSTTDTPRTTIARTSSSSGPTLPPQSATATGSTATPSPTGEVGAGPFSQRVFWPSWQVPKSLPNFIPVLASRGFIMIAVPLYQQLMTYEPVRQLTSSAGVSGAVLAGSSFGALHLGLISAHIGSAFSAGSLVIDTNYCNIVAVPNDLNPCPPRMSVTPWAIDVVLVCLAVQVIVIIYAMSKWFQRPSGLSADPTTIAGVAAVMGHPEIERQFSAIPGEMTQKELKDRIKDQQYKLGVFTTESGLMKYGIVPGAQKEKRARARYFRGRETSHSAGALDRVTWLRDWKQHRLYSDLIFATFLLALLGLTAAALARVDSPQTVFLATAAAAGTGMKIFFAALGIIVSFYWGRLFQGRAMNT